MCPLRIILIFLSATLAGFFLLRGLKSQPDDQLVAHPQDNKNKMMINSSPLTKARSAICGTFWTCIDMASGRYLWRNLVSSSSTDSDGKEK